MRASILVLGLLVVGCPAAPSPEPAVEMCDDGLRFERHDIDPAFRGEGVAVFDVNKDGRADIVTGAGEAAAWPRRPFGTGSSHPVGH